jgi:hypothetical protein
LLIEKRAELVHMEQELLFASHGIQEAVQTVDDNDCCAVLLNALAY